MASDRTIICDLCEARKKIDDAWVCTPGPWEETYHECVDKISCDQHRCLRNEEILTVGQSKSEDWSNLKESELLQAYAVHVFDPTIVYDTLKSGHWNLYGDLRKLRLCEDRDIILQIVSSRHRYSCRNPPAHPYVDYHDYFDVPDIWEHRNITQNILFDRFVQVLKQRKTSAIEP